VNAKSTVFAVDMLKGTKVWSTALLDPTVASNAPQRGISIEAPIAFGFGNVIVVSSEGDVIALDAKVGSVLWKRSVPYNRGASGQADVRSTPSFVATGAERGMVVVLWRRSGGGGVEALLTAFDGANGNLVWETPDSEPYPQVDGHVSVQGKLLAFGSCGAAIHILSVTNGLAVGEVGLGSESQVAGGVAFAGKRIFSGSRCGSLYCVDVPSRKVVWDYPSEGEDLFSTPAANDDVVVIAAKNGAIVAVDAKSGKRRWIFGPKAYDAESPVIAGNRVVVVSGGKLYVLDIENGKTELWSQSVGDRVSAPAVCNGVVVVGYDDSVIAFGPSTGNAGDKK
jgi:outer membrane protein assembly factor BamB